MSKPIYDYEDGDFAHIISDNMAIDSEGDKLMKISNNMVLDMDNGELHMISSWDDDEN